MDEGYDAVNVARALDLAAGGPSSRCRPRRSTARDGSRSRPPKPRRARRRRADPRTAPRPSRPRPARPRPRRYASLTAALSTDARSRACRRASSLGLAAILAVAAVLRFVDLPTRGQWDADQGHDMLVLCELVQLGQLAAPRPADVDRRLPPRRPLLLPPRAGRVAVGRRSGGRDAAIALAGVAAVAVTWWLARSIGGPVAGLVAGLLMAVSASAVEESTFIWNPNLIALSSSIALAGAWRAWSADEARRCVDRRVRRRDRDDALPRLGRRSWRRRSSAPWILDVRRRTRRPERRRVLVAGAVGSDLLLLSYVPLAIHELDTTSPRLRAALGVPRRAAASRRRCALPVRIASSACACSPGR